MNLRRTTHPFGVSWSLGNFTVFFGNKKSDVTALKSNFASLSFAQVNQVHGSHAVESVIGTAKIPEEADGHWTSSENLALVIKTADCIPIFVIDPKNQCCAGVHAGWRGVSAEALKKTLQHASQKMSSPAKDLHFFIGPHIQKKSFEIELEFANQILGTVKMPNEYLKTSSGSKVYVDLNQVIRRQIIELGASPSQIFGEIIDTRIDPNYCSYRRDGANAGRQNSFVAMNKIST